MRFIPSILRSFPFNVMLYFVGFLSPPLPAAAASYDRIQTLSMDEGLPHSDVNAITQDRDGYLWFATFSGLSKYDGYRLQTFRTDNSDLTSDRILCLFVARDSSLYIGTESGGLNRYDPVSETIFPVAEEPTTSADQVINNIFEDRKGTVWVCRNDGLGYLTLRGATTYLHVKNRWRGFYIQCGTALDSCRLLLSTDAGPVIYNPETEEIQNILRDEIKTRCFSMQSFADGKIALSGGWGVRIYDPKTDDLQRICDFSSRVTTQDNHGNIWVGSFNRGLYKYDRNGIKIVHYHPKLPIPHAVNSFEISALFEDRSGVLWIGTIGGGLSRLNVVEKHIECYTEAQGLCENRIITFLEARDGILWVSTHGGINLFNRSSATFRELRINGLPSIQFATVSAFFMAENGDIWLGTWDKGLWVIDSRDIDRAIQTGQVRARQLKHPVIDGELSVFRIVEDRDRHLWISSNRGCFEYIPSHGDFKTGQWINYTHNGDDPNSLCSNFTTDIYPDTVTDNKTIWIGTRSGLNRIVFDADGKANCQRIELAATNARERKVCSSDAFISTIHCDRKEGGLWIATIGEGLFLMTEGRCGGKTPRFSCFDTSNSRFFNNELESLQEDDHGAFWIGGYGITRFDPRDHSIRHFTVKDQLQSNSFKIWASYRLRNGEMVFGGVKGFNIFHPDSITDNDIRPRTAIELCRKIKENSRTSAIGVILLTAHNLQNYEVSGYRVGADAYVAKPFSLEVLFSRIDNLVARQNKIHKNSQPIKEIPISEVAVEKSEDLFLVKCTETIETEIADPRFDVLQLCRKIGVSRSQLYRRILALTGLTPIQFIRSIRLKHAASFLAQDGTLPVNEVMYRVGYTNLSHFAKIFHEEFGLYPKEFALRNRSKTGKVDSASEIFSKNEPETQK